MIYYTRSSHRGWVNHICNNLPFLCYYVTWYFISAWDQIKHSYIFSASDVTETTDRTVDNSEGAGDKIRYWCSPDQTHFVWSMKCNTYQWSLQTVPLREHYFRWLYKSWTNKGVAAWTQNALHLSRRRKLIHLLLIPHIHVCVSESDEQIMPCHLFDANPFCQPMLSYCQLKSRKHQCNFNSK